MRCTYKLKFACVDTFSFSDLNASESFIVQWRLWRYVKLNISDLR